MLTCLLEQINHRIESFDGAKGLGSKLSTNELKKSFAMPLVRTFEEKIFSLSKSSYVQYLPLFIMSLSNNMENPVG